MLPAQRDRIDSLFLEQKTWDVVTWRERYLDHGLVGRCPAASFGSLPEMNAQARTFGMRGRWLIARERCWTGLMMERLFRLALKIRDRCELTDKFLVVRGDIRTYKIHLVSGNILMKPNDQYRLYRSGTRCRWRQREQSVFAL